jgi:hypothetical protein
MSETRRETRLTVFAVLSLVLGGGELRAAVVATPGGVRFTHSAPHAREVLLAGSFNDWNGRANPMALEEGGMWSAVVPLPAGAHEYKFVVDGNWVADPENPVTLGDYGNSGMQVDERGQLVELQPTSNTPYSTKIMLSGRTIGLFKSRENPANGDRFELRRPDFDTDLELGIRMNEVLRARILTNINNESENIEQFRTRLNFDRGYLHFVRSDASRRRRRHLPPQLRF